MSRKWVTGIFLLLLFLASLLVLWKPWAPGEPKIKLGLDLQGGLRIVLEPTTPSFTRQDLDVARTVIENRVNALGVAEPLVQIQGNRRIVVELPGLSKADEDRAIRLIGQTAVLEFRILNENAQGLTVADINQQKRANPNLDTKPLEQQLFKQSDLGPVLLTGKDLANAQATFDQFGRPQVSLTFTGEGAKKFEEVTRQNIGRRLAVVLDGKVFTAPTIRSAISGGQAVIEGLSGLEEASEIALVLRSGSLPISLREAETRAIGPTLGQDAIRSGIYAGIVGTALIFVLIFAYYGFWLGLVAALGLIYTSVLILGIISGLSATLTLPGIAGLILTLGAAVDGNVLSFERIKEELKHGKRFRQAIPGGFQHSIITILDVNACHLLAAAALYQYSTGPVKGFAVMLAVGVVASVFSNLVFSRWLLDRIAERREVKPLYWVWGSRFQFMKWARYITTFSLILAAIGGGIALVKGFNLGIDFTGGTAFTVRTGDKTTTEDIRSFLNQAGIPGAAGNEAIITALATQQGREYTVRVRQLTEENRIQLERLFQQRLSAQVLQSETVGPSVGSELKRNTIYAVLIGLALILVYVAFRFDWMFGLASIIAVAHDVAIVAGMYSLFRLEFTIPTVAALLTIIGYSLNDSIIISDRIRENLKDPQNRGKSYREIFDLAINQTLSRTVMTTLTTLLPVIALLFLGGSVLRDFSLAITVGIFVGTYSSIYVVSALVVAWKTRQAQRQQPAKAR
ncbi:MULTISPECIES: protein translocase subunit SecD [unclassified Meiothermus]|uniref:protein translocase subunit SecD n=1 Tax=unclassified Meiothermus TaxID=370471 RepID=UPI000D7BACA0|nr:MULTISPECIES: protein translocase subunit SecD [unclassified Meiothermus]PZA08994.1 protein translocase subunit SecDF [Meiothermus sp. Pnk-1]RYM40568.1 protein translocase subunit SecD [Meiothermus sp. PNK-Is4]